MNRFVLAVALTGLISATTLAGNIPTNDSPSPSTQPATESTGNIPTNDVVSSPPPPTSTQSATSTDLNVIANVLLTVLTLIGR